MEIFYKNKQGQLEETNLKTLLSNAFKEAGFTLDNGRFEGEDYSWVGVIQENKSPSEITTNICFKDDDNTITQLKIFEAPIERVVVEDRSRQII